MNCPWGEISFWWNVLGVKYVWDLLSLGCYVTGMKFLWCEVPLGWIVLELISPWVEMFLKLLNCPYLKCPLGWNVLEVKCRWNEMPLDEMSGDWIDLGMRYPCLESCLCLYDFEEKFLWDEMSLEWSVYKTRCPRGWNVPEMKFQWCKISLGWNVFEMPSGDYSWIKLSLGWIVFESECFWGEDESECLYFKCPLVFFFLF